VGPAKEHLQVERVRSRLVLQKMDPLLILALLVQSRFKLEPLVQLRQVRQEPVVRLISLEPLVELPQDQGPRQGLVQMCPSQLVPVVPLPVGALIPVVPVETWC
jgi:hypothetical protein